jgi:hypothetical protein
LFSRRKSAIAGTNTIFCHQSPSLIFFWFLARNFLRKPHLPIVNPETRVDTLQPRLKTSLVEVMVGSKADADVEARIRHFLAAQGLDRVPVTRAGS